MPLRVEKCPQIGARSELFGNGVLDRLLLAHTHGDDSEASVGEAREMFDGQFRDDAGLSSIRSAPTAVVHAV